MLLNVGVSLPLLLIAYLIPLIVYSLNYYGELEKDAESNPERALLIGRKRRSYPFIIGGYALSLFILVALYANVGLTLFIIVLALSGVVYTITFKDLAKGMPGLKNAYTSLIWASGGAFFLMLYHSDGISLAYVLIFLFMFLKSFINVIFFDLKDIESDRKRGLMTIPIVLGKEKTLNLLQALNVFAFVPLLAGIALGVLPLFALSLLVIYVYTFAYLNKARRLETGEIRLASYTLSEAEILLWPIMLVVGRIFFSYVAK